MAIGYRQYSLPMLKDAPKLSVPLELKDHPLFTDETSVGMVSPDNPNFPAKTNGGLEQMQQELQAMGLKADLTEGQYGKPERSFIVYGPTREQLIDLGGRYGQESVVYSKGGKHEIIYTNGPNSGHMNPGYPGGEFFHDKPEKDYTLIPGKGYLRLHFNWDDLRPVQSDAAEAQPEQPKLPPNAPPTTDTELRMSERECTHQEIAKELAKTIQGRIDAYSQELLQLRKREMKLSKSEVCPICGNSDSPETCTCLNGKFNLAKSYDIDTNLGPRRPEGKSYAGTPSPSAAPYGRIEDAKTAIGSYRQLAQSRHGVMGEDFDALVNNKLKGKFSPNYSDYALASEQAYDDLNASKNASITAKAEMAPSLHEKPTLPGKPVPVKIGPKAVKSEDFIDLKNASDSDKRLKNVGGVGTMPDDKKSKKVGDTDGTGGDVKKDEVAMAKPPSGVSAQTGPKPPSGVSANKPAPQAKPTAPIAKAAVPMNMRSSKGAGAEAASYGRPITLPGKSQSMSAMAKPPSAFENIAPDENMAPSGLELASPKKPMIPGLRAPVKDPKPAASAQPISKSPLAGNSRLTPKTMAIATGSPTAKSEAPINKSELGTCPMCKKSEHPGKCNKT